MLKTQFLFYSEKFKIVVCLVALTLWRNSFDVFCLLLVSAVCPAFHLYRMCLTEYKEITRWVV